MCGRSAGGCNNNASVKDNPQFQLSVTQRSTVYIFVAQRDHRGKGEDLAIGVSLLYTDGKKLGRRCVRPEDSFIYLYH